MPVKKNPSSKAKKPVAKKAQPVAKKSTATKAKASAKSVAKKPIKKKKVEIKTKSTNESITKYLSSLPEKQQKDSAIIISMMKKVTKEEPKVWGAGLIGFGDIEYTSERTGRTVDWFKMGFAPRKANLTFYLGIGHDKFATDLKKLGKYKTNGGCLYINKLDDVDLTVLEAMIKKSGF